MEDCGDLSVRKPPTQRNSQINPAGAGVVSGSSPPAPKVYTRRGRPKRSTNAPPARKRISIPTSSYQFLLKLKQKHRLSSLADAVQWLFHRIRPDIISYGPTPKPVNKRSIPLPQRSDPKPACMPLTGPRIGDAPVRATVVQAASLFLDTPGTLDKAERLIVIAAAYGSHLVVFPEAFVGGYPWCMSSNPTNPTDSAVKDFELLVKYCSSAITVPGPEFERLQKIAAKNRVYLVMGVVERCGNFLFSTVLFLDPLGRLLGQQRKLIPLPSETGVWTGGKSSLPVYKTLLGNIGGLISWDSKLPLLRNELYSKGVEIYCAPTADASKQWKSTAIHVAVEGNCFVLSANQFCRRKNYPLAEGNGNGDEIMLSGGSFIASPSGTFLSGPDYEGECLVSADLDLQEINLAKKQLFRIGDNLQQTNQASLTPKSVDAHQVSLTADLVAEVPTAI